MKRVRKMGSEIMMYEKFAEADQTDLPAEASAQAGATIRKNMEVLGYGE